MSTTPTDKEPASVIAFLVAAAVLASVGALAATDRPRTPAGAAAVGILGVLAVVLIVATSCR